MVSMIPFGLLASFVGDREVRITELDDSGFCFRLGKIYDEKIQFSGLKICFYDMEDAKYNELEIREYEIQKLVEESSDFFVKYKVTVKQEDYVQAVQKLFFQYNRYIHLKLEDDDSLLIKTMTGYPGELDVVKCDSLEEQVEIWKKKVELEDTKTSKEEIAEKKIVKEKTDRSKDIGIKVGTGKIASAEMDKNIEMPELCLELDRPELYGSYLDKPLAVLFQESARRSIGTCKKLMKKRIMAGRMPDRLYIGNQFCHLLFPDRKILFQIMEKALVEQVKITIVFSYVREYMLASVKELLHQINTWCEKKKTTVEVVINDWGMAELFERSNKENYIGKNLFPCLGVLLNKRKKDPRIFYKKGEKKLFRMNNLNADFYRDYLAKTLGIERFEWESCGYEQQFPSGKNSLHIPFYQTNTSQYCPLRAVCENGERGRQKFAKECPEYCRKYALLYPEHLHMVGRYNSLFGIDMGILKETELLENYIENGVDRVVISLL